MDTNSLMDTRSPIIDGYSSPEEPMDNSFNVLLSLSPAEKRELISLWKARKANEYAAVQVK